MKYYIVLYVLSLYYFTDDILIYFYIVHFHLACISFAIECWQCLWLGSKEQWDFFL